MAMHGQLNVTAEPTVEQDGPGHVVLNGHLGLGQYVVTRAMEMAIDKAKQTGIGIAWAHHWHDIGCAGAYSSLALDHDCVGVVTVNSVPLTAPWGGRDMLMSAAPFSFVCPAGEEPSIIGDVALCGIWDFQMIRAIKDGTRLDRKWLVDPETGELSDDPARYVGDPDSRVAELKAATVFPDHKIYALNIFSEILTGLLTPGGLTSNQHQYPTRKHVTEGTKVDRGGGACCIVIDVGQLMPVSEFKAKVDQWIRTIKGSGLMKGAEEILLPGERAQREKERRLREGVPILDEHWAAMERIAADVGVDLDALR
jgi:LDH2 family malate/lactate/ureidoglycolate dehydrogenase